MSLDVVFSVLDPSPSQADINAVKALLQTHWKSHSGLETAAKKPTAIVGRDPSQGGAIVAFARLQSMDNVSQDNAVCYYVCVDARIRRGGIGSSLMEVVATTAKAQGFAFLYLCTPDMQEFYRRCGFSETRRPSRRSRVQEKVGAEGLSRLSNMLVAKLGGSSAPWDDPQGTWFRKRLLDARGVQAREMEDLPLILDSDDGGEAGQFPEGRALLVPWQRQIGVTCGIVCVNMLAATRYTNVFVASLGSKAWVSVGRLQAECEEATPTAAAPNDWERFAISRNMSHSGEIFCVENMADIVRAALGSGSKVDVVPATSLWDRLIFAEPSKCVALVPYDRDQNDYPALLKGQHSHWGLVVGWASLRSKRRVLLQQGMSPRVLLISLDELVASNAQLSTTDSYTLPEAVVPLSGPNLSGKVVIVRF